MHYLVFISFLSNILTQIVAVDGIGDGGVGNSAPPMVLLDIATTTNLSQPKKFEPTTNAVSPKSTNFLQQLYRSLSAKKAGNALQTVQQQLQQNGSVEGKLKEQNIAKVISNDHNDQKLDGISELALANRANFSHTKEANCAAAATSACQQQEFEHVCFSEYWHSVQEAFNEQNGNASESVALKVPIKVIGKIVISMMNAFLKKCNEGGNDQQPISEFDEFPQPQNFIVQKESKITKNLCDNELMGNVQIVYDKDLLGYKQKPFYDYLYKSPQKMKDNMADKFKESDIVWAFGVIMFELLTNYEHPFEGLKEKIMDAKNRYKSFSILKLTMHYPIYVDKSGNVFGGGKILGDNLQRAITSLMSNGEELPIDYENVMPSDDICSSKNAEDDEFGVDEYEYICVNAYEPLINLTKQCLQTYENKRIKMDELRKKLDEIAVDK